DDVVVHAIRGEELRYIDYGDPERELFDIGRDGLEQHNLYPVVRHADPRLEPKILTEYLGLKEILDNLQAVPPTADSVKSITTAYVTGRAAYGQGLAANEIVYEELAWQPSAKSGVITLEV